MKIEQQVTSLELSKILEKFGVKQKSLFYWTHQPDIDVGPFVHQGPGQNAGDVSAFTVAELGEILKNVDEPSPGYSNGSWWWYKDETGEGVWDHGNGLTHLTPEVEGESDRLDRLYKL